VLPPTGWNQLEQIQLIGDKLNETARLVISICVSRLQPFP